MNRGSAFRKWDLHVHTPESYEHSYRFSSEEERRKYKNNIWEKYVCELEKVEDICAIGITDYFTVDGYKKILDYVSKGRLKNFSLILPNVEFRLDKSAEGRNINYHVILSNEIDVEIIEKEFLSELEFPLVGGERRRLTKENIELLGKVLKETQKEFGSESDWVVGCKHIAISLEDIIKVLKSKRCFDGKYILVLAEPEWALLDWKGRDHVTRKNMLVQSHCIFSSNSKTRAFALGGNNPEDFVREFGSLKPCIHGSDCHDFDKFCVPDLDRYCWIKADPTFEGLKQILYEPTDRVSIQAETPEPRKNIYSIDTVNINECEVNDELSLTSCELMLNTSLVTVIGGKGEGKTALLDLIANCFEDRCYRAGAGAERESNSFVQRIENDNPDLKIDLKFVGSGIEPFSKRFTDEAFFRAVKVTYLPQGQIEEYSGNRKKLNSKIEEVIFSNEEVIKGNFKEKFAELQSQIELDAKQILEINNKIFEFEEESSTEVMRGIDDELSKKNGELQNKSDELKKLRESLTEEAQKRIDDLREKERTLREKKDRIDDVYSRCETLEQQLDDFKSSLNEEIESLNMILEELGIEEKVPLVDFGVQTGVISIVRTRNVKIDKEVEEEGKKVGEELGKLEGIEKVEAEILSVISGIESEIKELTDRKKSVEETRKRVKEKEGERSDNYVQMLSRLVEWREFYEKVIEVFSRGSSGILSGVTFEARVHFDMGEYEVAGEEILDMRSVSRKDIERVAKVLEDAATLGSEDKIREKVEEYITKVSKFSSTLKQRRSRLDFYNWAFKNYFSPDTAVFFNGIHMDKLSIGQKGTVLLKIFLAEGDYPLIVDMPEENLDNKFIYDELVGAFREAKKKRQLIIATNNANLVVNADAEQIIVAEFNDNVIRYRVGSIEDQSIRQEITKILEGGPEAIRKREQKYGMLV